MIPAATRAQMLELARAAAAAAYCPYSRFRVGAAVLAEGQMFTGCNIENASYGLTVCAERVALFSAAAYGCRRVQALAVACPDAPAGAPPELRMCCGACRQVIAEFASPDVPVYVDGVGDVTVADLLPRPFVLSPAPPIESKAAAPKLRLVLDLDNVLADTDTVMREVIRNYTGSRVNFEYGHISRFNYHECKDARGETITRDDWHRVHDSFSEPDRLMSVVPYPGVQEHLTRLGTVFELHIATARLPQARETTVRWLREYGFPPHRLHFLGHGEKHLSLGRFFAAVEDDRAQAELFARAGTHSFLLAHPWNEMAHDGPLHRHRDWGTMIDAILHLAGT